MMGTPVIYSKLRVPFFASPLYITVMARWLLLLYCCCPPLITATHHTSRRISEEQHIFFPFFFLSMYASSLAFFSSSTQTLQWILQSCFVFPAEILEGEREREMGSVWKTKVLPGLTKLFDKDGKKAAAAEFLKSFNKEEIGKEIDDKKAELEPKVVEVVESSPDGIKALLKDKKPASKIKKNAPAVTKFLEELAKIEFPGAKALSDAVAKSGTTPLSGAIVFLLGKVAPFVPKEEPAAAAPEAETTSREVAVEEKKEAEEEAPAPAAEPAAAAAEAAPEAAAAPSTEVVVETTKEDETRPAEPTAEPEKK
ncbi:hypothetical protein GUJ93_ZPchr0008g12992 [Zizania palustris]|uniref:Salt stress root protein RS1 n=1 Tax=Zizania palustris TaxID=103762 RepID=A0A8J5QWZ4_ZIZPA|nr:hypothetical protein GUJ93_ZPchr0008g12992 [Zizania palustris]